MPNPVDIARNIHTIQQRIAEYAEKYDRQAQQISLLAVSKTRPVTDIQTAFDAGQRAFGENYLQEALVKIQALASYDIEWHFIGSIQSNKTRDLSSAFHWVHSVDRLKIAQRLSEQRPAEMPPLNICLQVNISNETSKSGIQLHELSNIALPVSKLPHICLRGLMAIPAKYESFAEQRSVFKQLHDAMEALNQQGLNMDTLSMGMSNDIEAAIAEGSTMLRIGSAIFGSRTYNKT